MPETPLPSRAELTDALEWLYRLPDGGYHAAVASDVVRMVKSGRLVDREATKELVQAAAEAMQADPTLAAVFVAALGGTDNEEGDGS